MAQLLLYKDFGDRDRAQTRPDQGRTGDDLMQKRCNIFQIQKQLFVVALIQILRYHNTHTHILRTRCALTERCRVLGFGVYQWLSVCVCVLAFGFLPNVELCYANTPCILASRLLPAGKVIYTQVAMVQLGVVSTQGGMLCVVRTFPVYLSS